jgi:pyruvate/2-oxoglutarate dehydrogenase complex dihydrolipoamide dehydrogenase (E3) component
MTASSASPARRVATLDEARRLFAAPKRERYDVIVIGGGSAGLSAAGLAAALGARVALLDSDKLGGECLYTGCVPSKALLHAARVAAQVRRAGELGLDARLGPVDLGRVADAVQRVIGAVYEEADAPENYAHYGIDVVLGPVRFLARDAVEANGHRIRGGGFLLATGSHAALPDVPGLEEVSYLTNESVFDLRRLPETLTVLGGGPVGCELGQAFARLGSRVTILQRAARLLPRDEPEASAALLARLEAEGVRVLTSAAARSVALRDGQKIVTFEGPDGAAEVAADELLVAVGRAPNLAGLDLEAAGVRYDPWKGVAVDAHLRTSNPRVSAAGDVIGGNRFTHAAALQARTAVRNMLFRSVARTKLDERVMPWATFTQPEVAHVGLTEAEARRRHGEGVRVYTQPLPGVDRAWTDGEPEGFIKLVATPKGMLLGATVVGLAAGELINELALALKAGIGLSQLAATTHVYPTLALGIQQAAGKYSIAATARSPLVRLFRTRSQ